MAVSVLTTISHTTSDTYRQSTIVGVTSCGGSARASSVWRTACSVSEASLGSWTTGRSSATNRDVPTSTEVAGVDTVVQPKSGIAATDTKEVEIDPSYARKTNGVRIVG